MRRSGNSDNRQDLERATEREDGLGAYQANARTDLETLAGMATRLAGRNPDEHVRMQLGDVVIFDGVMWRYPDFLQRAKAAQALLADADALTLNDR